MEASLLEAALWFGMGVLSYKLMAYLVGYGRSAAMIQKTIFGLLLMLKYYDKVFQSEKDKIVAKIKEENPDATASHKLLDLTLEAWRFQSVRSIKKYLPPNLQGLAAFKDWDEAMRFIDKIEKGITK
tara:strand:- start:3410 stop:3790 length:381 start_codon:yes stop_codon:yes gene_type:complete